MIPKCDVVCREEVGALVFDPVGRIHKNDDVMGLCAGKADATAEKMAQRERGDLESATQAVEAFLEDIDERKLIGWH